MDDEIEWFNTKVDWWLGLLLLALPFVCLFSLVALALSGESLLAGVPACLIVLAIYGGLLVPMRYGIGQEYLVVRFGLARIRVPLRQIVSVQRTHNPLSSPALSLDRLRIRYGEGLFNAVMISPADQEGFRDLLARRTGLPSLRSDG